MPLNMENCAATIIQSSKKIIGGLVLEIGKKKKHLSNSNAQTRIGIVGQLPGLLFGPDEYLAKNNVYDYLLQF